MTAPKIRVRGIRTPIPSGYILGKMSTGSPGDVELIHLNDLAAQIGASGHLGGSGGGSGIDQLTGDVTAGPGAGTQVATLATVNASPGSYTYASITVNGKGLVTTASSAPNVVSAGSYTNARITVNAQGMITAVANGPKGMLPLVTGDLPPAAIGTPDGQMIGVPL